jgi:hypothetical protein
MQNPDDPLAVETMEHRRQIEAADARFRATLSRALRRGEETLQGCVGRHERLRNSHQHPSDRSRSWGQPATGTARPGSADEHSSPTLGP